jgi:NADH:quinone reductase (non-electrogenic)
MQVNAKAQGPVQHARPRVIVLGGGFGGLTVLKGLSGKNIEVVLVDRNNHHLFQPLLYQVAAAALSMSEIAQPIRAIMRGARNVTVRLDEAVGVDLPGRRLLLADGSALPYDMLVVATGVDYDYFGHPDWAAHAPSLKSAGDAIEIRRRLLLSFEEAEKSEDPVRRARLLTFVLVGGGPTGVEMAGSIVELARFVLRRDFRRIDPASARVVLVEAGPRVLGTFPERLSAYALKALQRMGVEVRLSTSVDTVDANGVGAGNERIEAGLVIWCAGVRGSSAGSWLGVPPTRHGTVPVSPDLSIAGHPEVFIVGDLAHVGEQSGGPLPQLAAVAKQQGAFVARVIDARADGRTPPAKFVFRNPGSLAIIGRSSAVVDFGWLRLTGVPAWLVWALAHIFFLIGFRNRATVFVEWAWEWFTYKRGARLFVGRSAERFAVTRPSSSVD